MCLDGGMYNGKRIVPAEYITEATRRQVNIEKSPNYGYGFWLNEYGYCGSGAFEQTLIVMPERRLVFAAHAFANDVGYIDMINNALNT
jgi:CubicO group peptidase (beta-lactamase class C family)